MEESIQFAKKYLEDILSFFGLNTDVHVTAEDDVIELNIPSTTMNGFLIGQRGETMRALQYLVGSALRNNNFEYSRVNVDVADYKRAKADRLAEKVNSWVESVKKSGHEMPLSPMNSADRRVVHKVVTEAGLTTESFGEGRDRHVVIYPLKDSEVATEPEVEPEEALEAEPKATPENEPEVDLVSEPEVEANTEPEEAPGAELATEPEVEA